MADSGSESGGPKTPGYGNREQFDHFDRLSKTDQKDLSAEKLKAADKEADVEELLATEDETNTVSTELHGGSYKTENIGIELSTSKKEEHEIPPLEELKDDNEDETITQEEGEEEYQTILLDPAIPQAPGTSPIEITPFEAEVTTPQVDPANPIIQQTEPTVQDEPDNNIPVDDEPPEVPEPPETPEPPEPPIDPPPPPEEPPEVPVNPHNCDDFPIPKQQPNGNYNVIEGAGLNIIVDSLTSNAGFNNSFGHYFADIDGNPILGKIDFVNVKDSLGVGNEAIIQYESTDIPVGAVQIGFFLIPNGANLNSQITDGNTVTFQNIGGVWTPHVDDNPIQGASSPAFYSDKTLNPDGIDHMNHTTSGELGWEDLFGGGDNDFNDTILNVTVQSTTDNNGNDDVITGTGGTDTRAIA